MKKFLFAVIGICFLSSPSIAAERYPLALLQVLDKVTTHKQKLYVPVGKSVAVGTIRILARACYKNDPEEPPQSSAFLEIYDTKLDDSKKPVFSGWMFKSNPSLASLEHAIYDVTVLDCSNASTN